MKRRTRYELKCGKCGYHYWLETFNRPNCEVCPKCGNNQDFDDFLLVVECEICGEKCHGRDSNEHKEKVGHNSWTLIVPKEMKDGL